MPPRPTEPAPTLPGFPPIDAPESAPDPSQPPANTPRAARRPSEVTLSSSTRFAKVAVARGIDTTTPEDALTYALPDRAPPAGSQSSEPDPHTRGRLVTIPLGPTTAEGVIVQTGGVELCEGFDPARVRPIRSTLPVALPDDLVTLGEWIARYYLCPLGLALAAMLPASVKNAIGARTITLLERGTDPDQHPAQDNKSGELRKLPPAAAKALAALDELVEDPFPADARRLADLIGAKTKGPINALVRAGVLRTIERETVRAPEVFSRTLLAAAPPPTPTAHQTRVINDIASTLGSFRVHVLRGVTGSGKTEVYLRLIDRLLDDPAHADHAALILVPEIALTPQTAGRFLARFESRGVAVLHSGLPASVRHQQWRLAESGKARVVIGARSAVFAPVPRLGLIVVDEEHDSSYKQDRAPRYHAREVAIKRAQLASCPVVLASATPSLESWTLATEHEPGRPPRATLHELTDRVGGGTLPEVRIVDLTKERPANSRNRLASVTPTLANALRDTLSEGGQAILLLNRRGVSSYLGCADRVCAWTLSCSSCDVAMVMHEDRTSPSARRFLRCHHCLAELLVPQKCPACQGPLVRLNPGTQSAEREVEELLVELGHDPAHILRRVDSDSTRSAADHFAILDAFGKREVRVLLGTQMLAKGLDFPNVRLVGVLNADTALSMPDFRATERTFQLLSQVAGRAGRGEHAGLVIVQTTAPDAPVIRRAAAHDYASFVRDELSVRRQSHYPPFARMARVVCRHTDAQAATDHAEKIAQQFMQDPSRDLRILGPAPCVIARIADHHRVAVELLAPDPMTLNAALSRARASGVFKGDAAVDVDPVALL